MPADLLFSIIGNLRLLYFHCCECWYFIEFEPIFSVLGELLAQVYLGIKSFMKISTFLSQTWLQKSGQIPQGLKGRMLEFQPNMQCFTYLRNNYFASIILAIYEFTDVWIVQTQQRQSWRRQDSNERVLILQRFNEW